MTSSTECGSLLRLCQSARFLATPPEVAAVVASEPPPAGIVWEIDADHVGAMAAAAQKIHGINACVPQLFRLTLESGACRQLCEVLGVVTDNTLISIRGIDDLAIDLERLHARTFPADAVIIRRIASSLNGSTDALAPVLIGAARIGRSPARVAMLAHAIGMSPRALRQRMREAGALEPGELLRWIFMLHCLWETERIRRPLKAIAREAGYKGAESLTNRLARLRGMRMRETLRVGGFLMALDEFASRFHATTEACSSA